MKTAAAEQRKAKPLDIRAIIKARLDQLGKTPNWLAERQTAIHPNSCRRYLYGGKDTTGKVIGELLSIIELTIVVAGGPQPNKKA